MTTVTTTFWHFLRLVSAWPSASLDAVHVCLNSVCQPVPQDACRRQKPSEVRTGSLHPSSHKRKEGFGVSIEGGQKSDGSSSSGGSEREARQEVVSTRRHKNGSEEENAM